MPDRSKTPSRGARRTGQPDRAWQRMLSGRRLDLLHPSPMDVEILDIAHGLARVSRWNGQTKGEYPLSVAQHSVMVERFVSHNAPKLDRRWRLAALLHDAPEYVIGDMITPFKAVLGPGYKTLEARLQAAIHLRFGLPAALPEPVARSIKRADHIAAYMEAIHCAGFSVAEAKDIFGAPRLRLEIDWAPWSPAEASERFLARFAVLGGG